ncbi:hypothetical protein J6Z39_06390 [bacterium]|nr:hypothetical protein [bacterium]
MKRYYYKVTLLADVVMSSLSSTEVSESLDYLSGSAFMGITANYLFKTKPEDYDVFDAVFSGKIRFLDAHPQIDGKRSFKIPLCLHKPKVDEKDENGKTKEIYRFDGKPVLRTKIDPNADPKDTIQMKQIRKGFFTAEGTTWKKVEPEHQYTMKSSYNRKSRRADDGALFGYDALVKGSDWVFVMECDDEKEDIAEKLNDEVFGLKNHTHRIGKSKTSQYGNVKIEFMKKEESDDCKCVDPETFEDDKGEKYKKYKVYADSRLCFFDKNGQPTFQPTPEQLGFKEGEILWNESFVRKYVFTPRNATRNAYDGDIACIDKGSVFTVAVKASSDKDYKGRKVVGEYQSIGLGQIIVNPEFLKKEPAGIDYEKKNKDSEVPCNDPLITWLESKQKEKKVEQEIAEQVNEARKHVPKGEELKASQWGVLRAKARMEIVKKDPSWEDFYDELFCTEKVFNEKTGKDEYKGYLFKNRLNKKWGEGKVSQFKGIFDKLFGVAGKEKDQSDLVKGLNVKLSSSWKNEQKNDFYEIPKLRFFELLCAAAAKDAAKRSKGGK